MKKLANGGRFITPLAMVVFLAYAITNSEPVEGVWWQTAVLIGAIASAFGLEIVGILSGHALERFWYLGDTKRGTVSFFLLLLYTGVSVYILRNNHEIMLIPVIAAVLYIVSALVESVETSQEEAKIEKSDDKEFSRTMAMQKAQWEHEEKLARIEQKKTAVSSVSPTQKAETYRQLSGNLPQDWRKLTRTEKHDLAHLPREERENAIAHLSERTRRTWHNRLDEIAAQNGSFLGES